MAGFYADFEFPKQVLLTRFELDPRKASASALEGKAQVTSDESGQKDTADAESGLERQESGVKTMEQSSSQQTEARRENAGSESLDKGPTLMDEARSLTAEAVRRTRQAELDADSVMSAQHALSLSTPSRCHAHCVLSLARTSAIPYIERLGCLSAMCRV